MTESSATDAHCGARAGAGQPLSVLAWAPGRNPYFPIIQHGLAAEGISVTPHRVWRCLFGRHDVWHVHFPERAVAGGPIEAAARAAVFALLVWRCRLFGRRIVWTVHNLHPHERRHPRLERAVLSFFAARADLVIGLSETGQRLAASAWPALAGTPTRVIAHPHYRDWYPNTMTGREARAALGIPPASRVVLLIGKMRPYKDPIGTIRAFRRLADPEARLIVAGGPTSDAMQAHIEDAARGDGRILLCLHEFSDREAQVYMNAADLVALPYLDILNSGSAIWALSFDRPVLLPDRGAMGELRDVAGPAWVRLFAGDLDAEELERALAWASDSPRPARAALDALAPARVARAHAEAFRAAAARPARR